MKTEAKILDACCGGKMFWFDKNNPEVLFTDIRREEFTTGEGKHKRNRKVLPDQIKQIVAELVDAIINQDVHRF